MFSESQRCKPPHLNVDTLKDKLFQVLLFTSLRGLGALSSGTGLRL